jgi:5-formyltetrahydrofolate cyclo-ligase
LRRQLRRQRRSIPIAARRLLSARIAEHLLALDRLRDVQRAGLYAETDRTAEVGTGEIHRLLRTRGIEIAYPRVVGDQLAFFAVSERSDLACGFRDIPEPASGASPIAITALDLIIVPGLGFSRQGHRLGQGGGHYDRTLAGCGGALAIGLAFDLQVLERVPTAPHDLPVSLVITESGVLS